MGFFSTHGTYYFRARTEIWGGVKETSWNACCFHFHQQLLWLFTFLFKAKHTCSKKKKSFIFVLFSTENATRSSSTNPNTVLLHDTVDEGYILQKFSDIFTMTLTWYTVLHKLFQKYLSLSNTLNFLHACTYNILSMNHKITAHFYCISN